MIISAIAAISKNFVIGKDNDLPWHMPNDLKYFMKTTRGHHLLMGRKNFESIGVPLRNRTNIIVTRNPFFIATGCITVHSIEEGIAIAKENNEKELFIIGGEEIYRQGLRYCDKLYLTEIDVVIQNGDTFFPQFSLQDWQLISEDFHRKDEKNPYDYNYKVYHRK